MKEIKYFYNRIHYFDWCSNVIKFNPKFFSLFIIFIILQHLILHFLILEVHLLLILQIKINFILYEPLWGLIISITGDSSRDEEHNNIPSELKPPNLLFFIFYNKTTNPFISSIGICFYNPVTTSFIP